MGGYRPALPLILPPIESMDTPPPGGTQLLCVVSVCPVPAGDILVPLPAEVI